MNVVWVERQYLVLAEADCLTFLAHGAADRVRNIYKGQVLLGRQLLNLRAAYLLLLFRSSRGVRFCNALASNAATIKADGTNVIHRFTSAN